MWGKLIGKLLILVALFLNIIIWINLIALSWKEPTNHISAPYVEKSLKKVFKLFLAVMKPALNAVSIFLKSILNVYLNNYFQDVLFVENPSEMKIWKRLIRHKILKPSKQGKNLKEILHEKNWSFIIKI